jgi:serine/threonine protein phosphatase PrpC
MLLAELDHQQIGFGQTTAVVLWVTREKIVGASAGDSGAWIIRGDDIEDLTDRQHRKPLIGDGAIITPLEAGPLGGGTLLVASDGLLRFANRAEIARLAAGPDLEVAARALIDLVRLPSGELPDDVSVVLCREV